MVELRSKDNKGLIDNFERKLNKTKERLLKHWNPEEMGEFDDKTWNRVVDLIKNLLIHSEADNIEIPLPDVLPLPDGAFDIHWGESDFHLTITIPPSSMITVDLYGQKIGHPEHEIEVLIHYDLVENVVASWLKKIL